MNKLLDSMIVAHIIKEEDREIYRYGIECFILKTVHLLSYFAIAILFKKVIEFLVFMTAYYCLRRNAGGYHASTRLRCYLFSCMQILCALLLYQYLIVHPLYWLQLVTVMFLISNIVIWCLAPIDNINKVLDEKERLHYKKRSGIVLLFIDFLVVSGVYIYKKNLFVMLIIAVFFESTMLILGKKGNSKNE